MSFNYDANKTHFHNKGFALSLVLKVKLFGTRKWPIVKRNRLGFIERRELIILLIKPSFLAPRRQRRFARETSAIRHQNNDDMNQCLPNFSGSHGVPHINLFELTYPGQLSQSFERRLYSQALN